MPAALSNTAASSSTSAEQLADQALDTLAAVIRTLAQYRLELAGLEAERFVQLADDWAKHVLSLAEAPGKGRISMARRDWAGVRQFVQEHRRTEQALLQKSIGDWRDVVSTFIGTINRSFEGEQQVDGKVLSDMRTFVSSIGHRTTEELKQDAASMAGTLANALAERKARHQQQMRELGQQVDRLGHRLSEAEREKSLDPLTSLSNRRVLEAALEEAVSLRHGYGHRATLAILDVDHFKRVNDTYGHTSGDAVLKGLANTLIRCFPRRSDVVVRFGGEEFAVLLSRTAEADAAIAVTRLQNAVRAMAVTHNGRTIQVSVSVGVAEIQSDQTVAQWIDAADGCLYEAKRNGRDRAVLASTRKTATTTSQK